MVGFTKTVRKCSLGIKNQHHPIKENSKLSSKLLFYKQLKIDKNCLNTLKLRKKIGEKTVSNKEVCGIFFVSIFIHIILTPGTSEMYQMMHENIKCN